MKILQFCFRVPYPLNDGGAIAMYNIAKGFYQHNEDLTIFSYNTKKHFISPSSLPEELKSFGSIYLAPLDASVKPMSAFLNLFSKKSYNISRFQDKSVEKAFVDLLKQEEFDLVHFEGLFTSPYVDLVRLYSPKSKVVLRAHNIEYKIWERMIDQESGLKKKYLQILTRRLKSYELDAIKKFDAIVPISSVDAEEFKKTGITNQFVSATGIDFDRYIPNNEKTESNSVFFIGSMNWMPNQEGVKWFLEMVWPLIKKDLPEAKFYIAGRNMPKDVQKLHGKSGIFVIGEVESSTCFMKEKDVMVVPLLSGSGIRIKILEGLAMAKPIVSTALGGEGLEYIEGRDIYIRDDPQNFADAVISLLKNKDLKEKVCQRARNLVSEKYNNKNQVGELIKYYKTL